MDLNRFTEKSQEALRNAQALATRRNHQSVDVEHLLAASCEETEGLTAALLAGAGIAPSAVRERVEQELESYSHKCPVQVLELNKSTSHNASLVYSPKRKMRPKILKDEYVSVEHLLLAMLNDSGRLLADS